MPNVLLSVHCDTTAWGESVAVLGSWNSWDKHGFMTLATSPAEYPTWHASVPVPDSQVCAEMEYKYAIVVHDAIVRWESSVTNRVIDLSKTTSSTDVFGTVPGRGGGSAGPTLFSSHIPNVMVPRKWKPAPRPSVPPSNYDGSLLDPLERAVVRHTHDHQSWRQRLSFVRSLFTERAVATEVCFDPASLDALATLAIYITFLSTGQVRCAEDGGHHRPNHHASEARQIDAALAALIDEASCAPPRSRNAYMPCVARKIFPHLPSYSSQFTVSVPLTRIRDIAHRNDIPKDIKLDIKHNLQNKLHRCAGPEDLHTSARILSQISHGGCSQPFVDQFHIFHTELQAFFNASSLDDRLRYLTLNEHTTPVASLASQLLADKHRNTEADFQLDVVVALRQAMADLPLMAPPRDPSVLPSEDVQKTRLTDLDLENYAFVLLAAEAKTVEDNGAHFPWARALHALAQAMKLIAQSGIRPAEATAAALELEANARKLASVPPERVHFQRARAAIDRALRFAHEFSAALTDVYERRVATLGTALGVERHAISVFAEAEIRSAITFQASRLADAAARASRAVLKLPPWDPLFEGVARGELVFADELDRAPSGRGSDVIVAARHADGDEDLPTHVKGVVLGRAIPHLSHLGVRARQAGVVFVCAEEQAAFAHIWETGGRGVHELTVTSREGLSSLKKVSVGSNGHSLSVSFNGRLAKAVRQVGMREISFDSLPKTVIPLKQTTKANASVKASFAGHLARLANSSGGLFEAPNGVAVPHGVFHEQVSLSGKAYLSIVALYNGSRAGGDEKISKAADDAARFIREQFIVQDDVVGSIQAAFTPNTRVMVRSSANAEDLEHMSGAGLYDSIANVIVGDVPALQAAIGRVWASLWTRRAASSRASYDIPHETVSMAVLVQEMVPAHLSFVAFSHDPVSGGMKDKSNGLQCGAIYIEMAIGMGDTLASASSDGNPYRFRVGRDKLDVEIVAMASYGEALEPDTCGGGEGDGLKRVVIDYSIQKLSTDEVFRSKAVRRIAKTVLYLEAEFSGPQDVEGAMTVSGTSTRLHVVQSRPQIL